MNDKIARMTFRDHIENEAIFFFLHFKHKEAVKAKIVSVESGGLWLESQEFHEMILGVMKASTIPRKPVLFFPYSEIFYAIAFVEGIALSEKRLGL